MKKIISFITAAFAAFSMTACDGGKVPDPKPAPDKNNIEQTEEQSPKKTFKAGVIYSGDPAEGSGSSYAHDQGIIAMQMALGLSDDQIIRKINVSDSNADSVRAAVEECAAQGCGLIFSTSGSYADVIKEQAVKYPDITFSQAFGKEGGPSNLNCYSGRIYQACYLSGIAAGLKTQSGLIGYVGETGRTDGDISVDINAFAMGVESVNPYARIYLKTGDGRFDPLFEQKAADELISMDCDVIAQHSDSAEPQLAAERSGVWSCGYNTDMTEKAPNAHLTAPIWNWGVYYTKAAKAVMEGKRTAENYFGGMEDGFINLSPLSSNCANDTKDAVEAAKTEILSGHDVFAGEIIDNQGNIVCSDGNALDDNAISAGFNWYYKNIEIK